VCTQFDEIQVRGEQGLRTDVTKDTTGAASGIYIKRDKFVIVYTNIYIYIYICAQAIHVQVAWRGRDRSVLHLMDGLRVDVS
jgi:hypothetical protein